jgi:hypothetical protein
MQVKIFSKCGGYFSKSSRESLQLEQDINSWLDSHTEIKIVNIKQSSSGGSLEPATHIISIWYETKA